MNKMIIGSVFSICGIILFSAILITGAIFSSNPEILWHNIFGSTEWGLSFLFYFAIALFLFGMTCLLWEHAKKVLKMEI